METGLHVIRLNNLWLKHPTRVGQENKTKVTVYD